MSFFRIHVVRSILDFTIVPVISPLSGKAKHLSNLQTHKRRTRTIWRIDFGVEIAASAAGWRKRQKKPPPEERNMLTASSNAHTSAKSTDAKERERLLAENLREVRYIARRIHDRLPAHVQFDDLLHAGILGLIDAVDKFDPAKSAQLKSYARFRIRGAILDSLRQLDWSPRSLRRQARRIEEAHRQFAAQSGHAPSEPELAAYLGMQLEEFQQLLGDLRGLDLGSLQAQFDDSSGEEHVSAIAVRLEEDPFHLAVRSEMRAQLARAVEALDEKERHVLALYYLEELTMKEVGLILDIGESRVSQIHTAALIRLRAVLRNRSRTNRPRQSLLDI